MAEHSDFTFATLSFTKPEDDEWGDFLEYPGSTPQPSPAPSLTQSNPTWIKPSGALPLSLFGEPEEEEEEEKKPNGPTVSNTNPDLGFNSVISNNSSSNGPVNGPGFDPNSRSPTVSRVQSLNYLASLSDETQQNNNNNNSSYSAMWGPDFDVFKSSQNDQNLHNRSKSAGFVFDTNALSSTSSWISDFEKPKLNLQNGLDRASSLDVGANNSNDLIGLSSSSATSFNRAFSLDDLTNWNNAQGQQIKTGTSNVSKSNSSGWNFSFDGFESTNKKSSLDVSGFNSNFGTSEYSNGAPDKNDDEEDDDGWEFKDAYSMSTDGDGNNKVTEAQEGHETKGFSFDFSNGLTGPVDLFATLNGSAVADSKAYHNSNTKAYSSGFGNSLNGSVDLFVKADESLDLFVTSSDGKDKQKDIASSLDPRLDGGGAESDEDFGEFTTSVDSGLKLEEEWKENDIAPVGLQASESDDTIQVKVAKLENHKGALPLSLFGDEELEINGSSNIQDIFVPHPASPLKNGGSPNSNISINDLISNLYSQAEQISSVHSVQVPNSPSDSPQDSVSNSNLVITEDGLDDGEWEFKDGSQMRTDNDDLDDGEWEFKDGSKMRTDNDDLDDGEWEFKDGSQMRADNHNSLLTSKDPSPRSTSNLNQDNYLDFYSNLRVDLCHHAKYLLGDLKRAQSIEGLAVEEAKVLTLDEEIEEVCKDINLDNDLHKDDHLKEHLSHKTFMSAFIEILQEPKFQVLESEYHLSRRLSLAENDLETTVDLLRHSKMMLKILRSGTLEEQSNYVSVWYKIISVCSQELRHGSSIWKKTLEMDAQSHVLSHHRGRTFFMALGEIYRVVVVVEASLKLCKPWTWLNSAHCTSIQSLLDECHTMWSSLGLGKALSSLSDSASSEDWSSIASLLDSLKLIRDLDALMIQKHLFAQKEVCRLSLLALEVLPGMKLIDWNGEHYFLTLANLWANLISTEPPELPRLILV